MKAPPRSVRLQPAGLDFWIQWATLLNGLPTVTRAIVESA